MSFHVKFKSVVKIITFYKKKLTNGLNDTHPMETGNLQYAPMVEPVNLPYFTYLMMGWTDVWDTQWTQNTNGF